MDSTIRVAKTKALISFAVTAKLICVFVFAYAGFLTTRLNYEDSIFIKRSCNAKLTIEFIFLSIETNYV